MGPRPVTRAGSLSPLQLDAAGRERQQPLLAGGGVDALGGTTTRTGGQPRSPPPRVMSVSPPPLGAGVTALVDSRPADGVRAPSGLTVPTEASSPAARAAASRPENPPPVPVEALEVRQREHSSPGAGAPRSSTPPPPRSHEPNSPVQHSGFSVSTRPAHAPAAAAALLAHRKHETFKNLGAVFGRLAELHAERQAMLRGSPPPASARASSPPPPLAEASPPASGWVPPPPPPLPLAETVRAKSPARRRRAPSPRTSFWASAAARGSARARGVAYNEGGNLAAAAAVAATALSPAVRAALIAENRRRAADADIPLRQYCYGGQLAAGRAVHADTMPSVQSMPPGASQRVVMPPPPTDGGMCDGDHGRDRRPADLPFVGWQPANLDPDLLRAAIMRRRAADDAYQRRLAESLAVQRSRRSRTRLGVLPSTATTDAGGALSVGVPAGGQSERSESVVVSPVACGSSPSTPSLPPFASSMRGAAAPPAAGGGVALPPSGQPPDGSMLVDGLAAAFGGRDDGDRGATIDSGECGGHGAADGGGGGVPLTRGRSSDRQGVKRRRSLSPSVSSLTPPAQRSATPPAAPGVMDQTAGAHGGGAGGDDASAGPCPEGGHTASPPPAAAADARRAAAGTSALGVTGVRSPSAVNDAAMTDMDSFYSATATGMRLPAAAGAAAATAAAGATAGVVATTTPTPVPSVVKPALPPGVLLAARDRTSGTVSSVGVSVGARTRSAAAAAAAVAAASLSPPGADGGVSPNDADADASARSDDASSSRSSSSSTSGSRSSTSDGTPRWVRNAAVIPDQVPPSTYCWTGGGVLLTDPLADAVNRRLINPWTPAERYLFLRRYVAYPKNFRRIASAFKRKSVADVVAHYYNVKLSQNLKQLPAFAATYSRSRLPGLLRSLAAVVPKQRSLASNFAWEATTTAAARSLHPQSTPRGGGGPAVDAEGTTLAGAPAVYRGSPWSEEERAQLTLGLCRLGQPPIEADSSNSSANGSNRGGEDGGDSSVGGWGDGDGDSGGGGGGGGRTKEVGPLTAAATPNGHALPLLVGGGSANTAGAYWTAMADAVGPARTADDCRAFFFAFRKELHLDAFGLCPPPPWRTCRGGSGGLPPLP
ncbi:hypothetical protein MMPV_003853 [Pyropia vietnamensis]